MAYRVSLSRFVRARVFLDALIVGGIIVTLFTLLLFQYQHARLIFMFILLTIAAAASGKFANAFGVNAQVKIGVELQLYAGIMLTYLSNPWVGVASILLGFYLMNRIHPLFNSVFKGQELDRWIFVEGIKDMLHYMFLEPNMWIYVILMFPIPYLEPYMTPLLLWNTISFAASLTESILNRKFGYLDRPDDIGKAPWKRFVLYAILFSTLSPFIVSFVLSGPFNL